MIDSPREVTLLLRRIADGDESANAELIPIVYAQLRALAHGQFDRLCDDGHTLQPTLLVGEAYAKIFGKGPPSFDNREHFLAVAASAMRQILVDYVRGQNRRKRKPNEVRVPFDSILVPYEENAFDLIDLDDALVRFAAVSEMGARIIEMRFFGGLEHAVIADILGVSVSKVEREWRAARAWLHRELSGRREAES